MRSNKPTQTLFQAGFTLLELLVVIAIILLLVGILYAGLQQYAYRQSFNGAVSQVQDQIVEARAKTLASVNHTTYGVYVATNTISFFSSSTPGVGATTSVVDLPPGVTAHAAFSTGQPYVSFVRLTGSASATGTITFTGRVSAATSTLTIASSGLVQ